MMKLQKVIALASLFLALTCIVIKAQAPAKGLGSNKAEAEIIDLDRRLQEAVVTGDVGLLERYAGKDLVFTHGLLSGQTDTKGDWISLAKKEPKLLISRKVSAQVVEIHGDVAIVLGRLDVRRLPSTRLNETKQMCYDLKYVHLYMRRHGRWQWVSHRTVSEVIPSPCP